MGFNNPIVLWAYRKTPKRLAGQTLFKIVNEQEVVMLMEFMVPNLWIATMTGMKEEDLIEKRLEELIEFEENRVLAGFHQIVQKKQ